MHPNMPATAVGQRTPRSNGGGVGGEGCASARAPATNSPVNPWDGNVTIKHNNFVNYVTRCLETHPPQAASDLVCVSRRKFTRVLHTQPKNKTLGRVEYCCTLSQNRATKSKTQCHQIPGTGRSR